MQKIYSLELPPVILMAIKYQSAVLFKQFIIVFLTSKKIYPLTCGPSKELDHSLSETFFGDPSFTGSLR